MARLINPASGTVVRLEGDLEADYRAAGWADADAPDQREQATPEKPEPKRRGRPAKTS